jgi:hypothetical protein
LRAPSLVDASIGGLQSVIMRNRLVQPLFQAVGYRAGAAVLGGAVGAVVGLAKKVMEDVQNERSYVGGAGTARSYLCRQLPAPRRR